ncbi:hypothetical protein BRADI_4g35045v3 [Brachypodium distachyon]|uniref:Uncharacterized protein n=2 Tax=Brachypodium distachyon TaxID=15368 RepID=A0A0Q3HRT5_BRADI|nr:hypothetical protein BRADI_4g35045v3 [Brachypodium distachyon]KQJ90995.1 hypothetical protein BRADI_4g35045v3 [Brachypodium distachyon]
MFILVYGFHLEMEVLMLTDLEYRYILSFWGPTQKILLVKHWMVSTVKHVTVTHQLDFQLKSHHVDECHQVGPTESYMVIDTQLEACWADNNHQLLNLHPKQVVGDLVL